MAKIACPPSGVEFHDDMQVSVRNDGEFSKPFGVTNEVKQGCLMAPTLFSMMFPVMLKDAFQDSDTGFPITCMQVSVRNDGEFSKPFGVTNEVKQGCLMAPTLFSMMFPVMLKDAFQDSDTGFPISYRFDSNLFNLTKMKAKPKGAD